MTELQWRPSVAVARAARAGLAGLAEGIETTGAGLSARALSLVLALSRRAPLTREDLWTLVRNTSSPGTLRAAIGGAEVREKLREGLAELDAHGKALRANPRKPRGGYRTTNPLEGLSSADQYRKLRWGLEPRKASSVSSTSTINQQLVELGRLRALFLVDQDGEDVGTLKPTRGKNGWPVLAVGALDNRLYLVAGSTERMARAGEWGQSGRHNLWIRRTDYEARKGKGSELVYWYHDHEEPLPRYVVGLDGRPSFEGGGYRVEAAGIVG